MATQVYDFGSGWTTGGGVDIPDNVSACSSSSSSEDIGTPHGDSPSDARPSSDLTHFTSPTSSAIDDLSILTQSQFWQPAGHFPHKPPVAVPQSRPFNPRNPSGVFRRPQDGHATYQAGGFRTSRTWMSPEAQQNQEFLVIRNAMRRLFKHSELAKWKLQDYIAHREAMVASQKAALAKTVQQKELEREGKLPIPLRVNEKLAASIENLLGAKNFHMIGNTSRVLGYPTIWCVDFTNGKDEFADWPTYAEMKWEGDDRAKTNCGRFLPLPREQGAPGIQWCQLGALEQYPLDQVQIIPTMEDVYLPVDQIREEDVPDLLDANIFEAIDEFLTS